MCEICKRFKCPSGCPNAPLPMAVCKCSKCRRLLYHGDAAYNLDGIVVCEDCVISAAFTVEDDG